MEATIDLFAANLNGDLYSLGKALRLFFNPIISYFNINRDIQMLEPAEVLEFGGGSGATVARAPQLPSPGLDHTALLGRGGLTLLHFGIPPTARNPEALLSLCHPPGLEVSTEAYSLWSLPRLRNLNVRRGRLIVLCVLEGQSLHQHLMKL